MYYSIISIINRIEIIFFIKDYPFRKNLKSTNTVVKYFFEVTINIKYYDFILIRISDIDFIGINCNINRSYKVSTSFSTLSKLRYIFSIKCEFLNTCISRIHYVNKFVIRDSYSSRRFKKSIITSIFTPFCNEISI